MAALRQARVIGMVGGLGPLATIYYYRVAVDTCRRLCGHAPWMVIYSVPVELVCQAARRGDRESVGKALAEAARALVAAGASVVFISANTPHIAWEYFRREAEKLGAKPVSIVEAAVEEAAKMGFRRLAVLGLRTLYETGLYQKELKRRGLEPVELPDQLVERVDKLVSRLALGEDSDEYRREALEVLREVAKLGADAAILACTELPAILEGVETPIPVIDTVRAQLSKVFELATEPD